MKIPKTDFEMFSKSTAADDAFFATKLTTKGQTKRHFEDDLAPCH
jgi:hypothetical protein